MTRVLAPCLPRKSEAWGSGITKALRLSETLAKDQPNTVLSQVRFLAGLLLSSNQTLCLDARYLSSVLDKMSRTCIMIKKRLSRNEQQGESPLRSLRLELDMSQEEFGRAIGTTARTISRWEAGDSVPTFTVTQMKALDRLLRSKGKTIQDLPDDFGPPKGQLSEET
jgi:putative transcriptional regulator